MFFYLKNFAQNYSCEYFIQQTKRAQSHEFLAVFGTNMLSFFKYINFNHMSGFLCVWNVTRFNYLFVFIIFFFCHQIKDVSLTGNKRTPNQIQDGGLFRRRGGREGLQVLRQARQTRLQTSPQRTRHGGWKRNYVSILVIYFALCSSSWLLLYWKSMIGRSIYLVMHFF